MQTIAKVAGGTLTMVEPTTFLTDKGFETAFKYLATSDHEGKSCTFFTRRAAEFWLWAINERCVSEARRLALA